MNTETTVVIYRKWRNGDIIALFPFEPWNRASPNSCMSYERIGQHGGADFVGVVKCSKAAVEREFMPLHRELTAIGYRLEVRKRKNGKRIF